MTTDSKEYKIMKLEDNIQTLRGRGDKNVKATGVLRKRTRQLRNLQK